MTLAEVAALPVDELAAPDAVLALRIPTPMKPDGLYIMDAWGFEYKTTFYWIKDYGGARMGMGFWHRGGVEELLIGKRGAVPPWGIQQPSWIQHPVLEHSRKPALFRNLVRRATRYMPEVHRVELFARREALHWISLGYNISGRDIREELALWVANSA